MAIDLFQYLVEILQISPQLVNEYSAQGPIYSLFYLFFFPMVFIIILVYAIMSRFSEHRGISILVGIAILAFIILQGWYNFFVYISRFWIILIVILGAFLAFFFHREKKGGSGEVTRSRLGGVGKQITGRLYRKAIGIEKELEKEVQRGIVAVESSNTDVSFTEAKAAAETALMKYREAIDIAGTKAGRYNEFEKELHKVIERQRKKIHVKKMA